MKVAMLVSCLVACATGSVLVKPNVLAKPNDSPKPQLKPGLVKLRGGGDMGMLQSYFHYIPAAVLILPALADLTGVTEGSKLADLMLTPSQFAFGKLPSSAKPTDWSCFGANLCIATGALYATCAITKDAKLAKLLCIPRFTIGLLNVIGLLTGKMSKSFTGYPLIELATAAWIHCTVK
jgi:hypothetical protein